MNDFMSAMRVCVALLQRLSLVLFAGPALCRIVMTLPVAFGVVPWITLPLEWNGAAIPAAGMYAQVGLTVFALSLCFFLPAN